MSFVIEPESQSLESLPSPSESPDHTAGRDQENRALKICLISLHGLVRGHEPELGRDADTGGQIKYVVELARELAQRNDVAEVEVLTRQIVDPKVSTDYAVLEEELCEGAKIVRIPFGPKRYLRKESLWPFIEMFIDQALVHFKRNGIPDVIHGHYADAGLAGAHLARLLHVPYVFTGHSLGRVKRERMSHHKTASDKLEKRYRFRQRIEAEETALETASIVVTSTHQEVEQQYQLYDHYVPDRMEVIPPGVDLSSFTPTPPSDDEPQIAASLKAFLREPEKPMVLAMARPDERKNLEMLVKVYGESHYLQEAANLVLVLGTRDDLSELPKAQQNVITNILHLIDKYDLYGKVAYPKSHRPSDVPDLYRLAAKPKGVFINPALTEPFGLTLLEAGATGLPIVATNDGGPRDIVANCENGLLIDPLDSDDIERALLRVLTEPEVWERFSQHGIAGTRKHYAWKNHAARYVRDVREVVDRSTSNKMVNRPARRLPEFDRLIITDLDNTLTGDDEALGQFIDFLNDNEHIGFGIATGRRLDSALEMIQQLGLPKPDLMDTDAGTQLHYGESLIADRTWQKSIGFAWQPDEIRRCLEGVDGLTMQTEDRQSEFKISYDFDPRKAPVTELKKRLRAAGLRARVVQSLGMFLDIIPVRGGSGFTMRHVLWKWGFSPSNVLVAGDSGNDAGMLLGGTLGVVVANHSRELNRYKNRPRVYFAERPHAGGILEGIEYYNFFDKITIPNDRTE
ncbi:HAD-IIB family hydrolase [Rhodopirellula sp. MGV]|uniref:HAD-IIB family hydrolase n=1 Tax=Rhodopirellula sp. MGV TaxID=2023130 RepID=UPI000B96DA9E|nr:HAD-IIB family hydrolase [Rhodopirellula sp. MGV]OYP29439.1 HAD family hydrolase [Rhodopirellula sp. MGV]PNY35745.1 HAD family hydrolase [Rhodopirellula baltica]